MKTAALAEYDLYLFHQGTNFHAYEMLGAHFVKQKGKKGIRFAVWAPNAMRVSVVGDFNLWDGRRHQMRRLGDSGVFELFIPGIPAGTLYKYEIKNHNSTPFLKADPYANAAEMRPNNASLVWDLNQFAWTDDDWMMKRAGQDLKQSPMSVYEVHLGSWKRKEPALDRSGRPIPGSEFLNYRELADDLADYVLRMGYTHVELMPVMEHPLDASWGYQTTGYYAPTRRFGTPDDFMYFMNHMHEKGIGVILDWVPANFPKDAWSLSGFDGSCLYEREYTDDELLSFHYGRPEVSNFLIANALFWAQVYHADGLRLDAVKHVFNTAEDNVKFWQKFYSAVNAKYAKYASKRSGLEGKADQNIFMVGEVLDGESTCRPYYAGLPAIFEFQFWWDLRDALNNDSKGNFVSGLCDRYYDHQKVRGDAIPTPKLTNHDEDRAASVLYERHRIRQAAAVLLTAPGRPIVYQGEELGYWGTGANGDEYRRAPILWTSDISSAATHGVNDRYDASMLTPSISVAAQAADEESLLTLYRRFAYARNTNAALADGHPIYDQRTSGNNVIMCWYMEANDNSGKACLVLHNISGSSQTVARDDDNVSYDTILVASDPVSISGKNVTMPPYSSVVFALN